MQDDARFTRDQFEIYKAHLQREGSIDIVLVSGSMSPIMKTGTRAAIEPCRFEDLKPFDFVVFFNGEILICHAIWDFARLPAPNGERSLITRGLANPFADEPVRESSILGRVTSHRVSKMGFYFSAFKAGLLRRLGFGTKTT